MSESTGVAGEKYTNTETSAVAHRQSTPHGAWQIGKTLPDSFSALLSSQLYTDVTFRMKDGDCKRSIKAHKIVLATRSPVFEAMFYGQLAETAEEIEIPDIEADKFQLFLKFLYTDAVELTEETAVDAIYIGNKYQVNCLLEFCFKFLSENIKLNDALVILDLALLYQQQQLADSAFRFIDDHADEVLQSDAFLNITQNALLTLLQGDTFFADELVIYHAAIAWAKKACALKSLEPSGENMRSVLGEAFFYIRLTTIPGPHVAEICQEGLLTYEEQAKLLCYINKPEIGRPPSNHVATRKKRISMCKPTFAKYEDQSMKNVSEVSTAVLIKCRQSIILRGFKLSNDISPAGYKTSGYMELAFSGTVSLSHSGHTFGFETKPTKFQTEFIKIGESGVLLDGSEEQYKLIVNVICTICPSVSIPVSIEKESQISTRPVLNSKEVRGPNCTNPHQGYHTCNGMCYKTTTVRFISDISIDVQAGEQYGPGPICSFSYEDQYRLIVALQYENVSNRKVIGLQ